MFLYWPADYTLSRLLYGYLLTSSYTEFPLRKVNGLLAEWFERCDFEAQNLLPMAAVMNYKEISDLWMLGWPIQFNGTFCNIMRSRIISLHKTAAWNYIVLVVFSGIYPYSVSPKDLEKKTGHVYFATQMLLPCGLLCVWMPRDLGFRCNIVCVGHTWPFVLIEKSISHRDYTVCENGGQ